MLQVPVLFSSFGTAREAALLNTGEAAVPCWRPLGGAQHFQHWLQTASSWQSFFVCARPASTPHTLTPRPALPTRPLAVIIGAVNVASTFVSIFTVDRFGRKTLFLEGGIQMFIGQVGQGVGVGRADGGRGPTDGHLTATLGIMQSS